MSCGCRYWIISGDCCGSKNVVTEGCNTSCEPTVDPWGPKLCPDPPPDPRQSDKSYLFAEGICPPCCLHGINALSSIDLSECEIGDTLKIYICKSDVFAEFELTDGVPCPAKPDLTVSKSSNPCVADLRATAAGCGEIKYKWYKGLSGDTSTPVSTERTARYLERSTPYWVRVTDCCGFTDSETIITNPPTIEISDITVTDTGQATVTVSQSYGIVTYQWFRLRAGQTPLLVGTTPTVNLTEDGTYFVVVKDSCLAIQSEYIQVSLDRVHEATAVFGIECPESVCEMTPTFGCSQNPSVAEMIVSFGVTSDPEVIEQTIVFGMQEGSPDILPSQGIFRLSGFARPLEDSEGDAVLRLIGSSEFTLNDDTSASGVVRLISTVEPNLDKDITAYGHMRLLMQPVLFTAPLTAVGENKTVLSFDGNWNPEPVSNSIATVRFNSIAISSSKKVVVGEGGVIAGQSQATSGVFEQETNPTGQSLARVIWVKSQSLFMAGGTEGTIVASTGDGTWTEVVDKPSTYGTPIGFPPSNVIKGIAYGAGVWVAVGTGGLILVNASPLTNGTWSQQGFGMFSGTIENVIWDGTQFVAVGSAGLIATSTDGLAWSSVNNSGSIYTFKDVAYDPDNNIHVAVGSYTIVRSTDGGLNWSNSPEVPLPVVLAPDNHAYNGIAFDGKNFVVVANNTVIKFSEDGTDFLPNWAQVGGSQKLFDVKAR